MKRLLSTIPLVGVCAYLGVAGQRLRSWGTRGDETTRDLPGQELVPGRGAQLTQAIDIQAAPERVWPWVAQLGQDKGGFYSYAWLENLGGAGIVNAEQINPQWQDPRPGGRLRVHPWFSLEILRVDPGELLVVGRPVSSGLGFRWSFQVSPRGQSGSRLLVRERYVVPFAPARWCAHVATVGSAVMSRGMLIGIRERAERV
ncbi:MAG: SRPBCC family protein [Ornithinimicrobium sp.]